MPLGPTFAEFVDSALELGYVDVGYILRNGYRYPPGLDIRHLSNEQLYNILLVMHADEWPDIYSESKTQ